MEAQPADKKTTEDYCMYGPFADEVVNEDTLHYRGYKTTSVLVAGDATTPKRIIPDPCYALSGALFRIFRRLFKGQREVSTTSEFPSPPKKKKGMTDRTFQNEMDKWLKLKERNDKRKGYDDVG
eukprot:g41603.t1